MVDFLLDHGVVVYPVNPKALDRARDRFRQAGAKNDPFDARVLAEFLRTDHPRLRPLLPSLEAAQEVKLLTEDCQRQIRQQTRLVSKRPSFPCFREAPPCPMLSLPEAGRERRRGWRGRRTSRRWWADGIGARPRRGWWSRPGGPVANRWPGSRGATGGRPADRLVGEAN